jgi:branched-chain amino acid transport system substrate-binding protein
MQKSRVKRVGALLVGLTLVAAACGSDDDASSSSEAPAGTEATTEDTEAMSETTEAMSETTEATAESETVQAAPTCTGESDGVVNIATVLPETGNLAFLGPPEFAGTELAIQEINEAGGALGQDVTLDPGDSGDTSTDIANQTVDRQLAAGADAFIGAAS